MENASKALLMAGGILIALLIIGSLVLLFANLQDYQNKTDVSAKQSQVAKFNNQFEPYNKKDLTLMELKSLYNKIVTNNTKYPEYTIANNINDNLINVKSSSGDVADYFFERNGKKFTEIDELEKMNRVFKCISTDYDANGRINNMQFEDITQPVESWVTVDRR